MEPRPLLRTFTSEETMDLTDLVGKIREMQVEMGLQDDVPTQISRGAFVRWYSPETPEEETRRLAHEAAWEERHAEWERVTYARLKAKFES